jgi:hypothetical protein
VTGVQTCALPISSSLDFSVMINENWYKMSDEPQKL